MAGRGGQVGPREPPEEGPGAGGRRRWQLQPRREPPEQHAAAAPPSLPWPAAAAWAAAAAAPSADPRRQQPPPAQEAQQELPGWWHHQRRRRAAMEPPAAAAAEASPWRLLRGRRRARWLRPGRQRGCSCRPPARQWRVLAAGLTCCTVLALYAASSLQDLPALLRRHHRDDEEDEPLSVLLWWEPFGRSRPLGDCRARYNISACRLTANRSRHQEAHAILFHHRDLILHGAQHLPPARPPAQRWVWMNFESPSHSPGLQGLSGLFNWTMSYRVDSDVFVPYGYLRARPAAAPPAHLGLPPKTKLVAWVISNWDEEHARVRYFHQLKKHLPVDVYGARGLELKDDSVVKTVSEYKFYLAFENSQHPDYITEKLWRNAFKSRAVPVVLGPPRSNYELFIPWDSFIHVDDFASPAQLAIYLKFLDKNKNRYRRYFAWRKRFDVRVTTFWDEHCCRVCEAIRAAGHQRKTVQNLAHWFES